MKIDFPLASDGKYHQYCQKCHSENIERIFENEKTFYLCKSCGTKSPRLIVIDPKIIWWIDKETKEYWHESVGVFVFNQLGQALFFERIIYPFAFTIPAGHLDVGEDFETAAKRELKEEAGINVSALNLFVEENIKGDGCRRGADYHKWHLYTVKISAVANIKINDEGIKPVWLSLDEALQKDLTYPVRYFIEKYGQKLLEN
ncbi:MAG: NUDIX hydrolase [Patescibacteria group bacterium]